MKPRLAHLIDTRIKYTPAVATDIRKTIAREIKRLGARPVVRVPFVQYGIMAGLSEFAAAPGELK